MSFRIILSAAAAALTLALVGAASASTPTLKGAVGPSFNISLKTSAGKSVTKLKAGTYTIIVSDKSPLHNFHLSGPGVSKTTTVAGTGTKTWTVKLKAGRYKFICDPHVAIMHGSFTVS